MIEVAFESIDVRGPEPAERSQPGVDLPKRFGFEPVETALCIYRRLYETGLAEYSEVL